MNKMNFILMTFLILFSTCNKTEENSPTTRPEILFTMPEESVTHEGTWLQ